MKSQVLFTAILIQFIWIMSFFPCIAEAKRLLRVGLFQNYPIVFSDQDGLPKGIYIDLLNEIAKTEGWEFTFVPDTWNNCLENLRNRDIDLMTNITYTKERDTYMDFSNENVLMMWGQVYVNNDQEIQNILDLKGQKIAILKGGINAINFTNLINKFQIDAKLIQVDTQLEIFELTSSGSADAGVLNNVFGTAHEKNYNVKLSPILFNPFNLLFAVPEGMNSDILSTIDEHIVNWKLDENSVYYTVLQKWYGKTAVKGGTIPGWIPYAFGAIALLVLFLFVWMKVLKQQVKTRTCELDQTNTQLKNEIAQKKQAEVKLKTSLKEKDTLLHEIHHRVKNNMQVIASLLSMQLRNDRKQDVTTVLQQNIGRVHAMAGIHENLHQSDNLSEIDFGAYVGKLMASLADVYSIKPDKVNFQVENFDLVLSLDIANPLGLAINELISNSLKYAFPDNLKGNIRIGSVVENENQVVLIVSDDGIGLSKDFDWDKTNTLGLQLVKELVERQLNGSIELDTTQGTRFTIKFNLDPKYEI